MLDPISNREANIYWLSCALFNSSKSLSLTPSHSLNNGEYTHFMGCYCQSSDETLTNLRHFISNIVSNIVFAQLCRLKNMVLKYYKKILFKIILRFKYSRHALVCNFFSFRRYMYNIMYMHQPHSRALAACVYEEGYAVLSL